MASANATSARSGHSDGRLSDTISNDDIVKWDIPNWSRALQSWLPYIEPNGIALMVGERDGGLATWFASTGTTTVCADLVPVPVDARRHNASLHPAGQTLRYLASDVTRLSLADATVDTVGFKSLLPSLGSRAAQHVAISELARVLKPGGRLFMAENTEGSAVHQFARRKFVEWSAHCRYLDPDHDRDLFCDFNLLAERFVGVTGALGQTNGQRSLLGALDERIERFVPESSRYIWSAVWEKPSS